MKEPSSYIRRSDMLPWVIPEYCEACADCVNVCPVYGLEMWHTENPDFSIPWLSNPDSCIGCGKCEEACTWGAINMTSYVDDARERLFTKQPAGLLKAQGRKKFNLKAAAEAKIAIVTCLDAKLHIEDILQENRDNAYILRNAGNTITECVIRSLVLAVDVLKVREVIIIGHRMCNVRVVDMKTLQKVVEDRIESRVKELLGKPFKKWMQLSSDPENNVIRQVSTVEQSKLIPRSVKVTGLMYDEFSGNIYRTLDPGKLVSV